MKTVQIISNRNSYQLHISLLKRCHLRNNMYVLRSFIAWWKSRRTSGGIREQINENPRRSREFHLLENSHKLCRGFQQVIKAQKTCFIFLWKTICKARMYSYISFMKLYILITWRQPVILLTSFSYFIALWKHTCRQVKTHVTSKLFYNLRWTWHS